MFKCIERTELSAEATYINRSLFLMAKNCFATFRQEVGDIRIFHFNSVLDQVLTGLAIAILLWTFHTFRLKVTVANARNRLFGIMDEQKRMAQVLQDSLIQDFQGILLQVQGISKSLSVQEPFSRQIEEVLDRADETLGDARKRLSQLQQCAVSHSEFEYQSVHGNRHLSKASQVAPRRAQS